MFLSLWCYSLRSYQRIPQGKIYTGLSTCPEVTEGTNVKESVTEVRDLRGVLLHTWQFTAGLVWERNRLELFCFLPPPIFKYKRNGFAAFLLVLCLLTGAVYAF